MADFTVVMDKDKVDFELLRMADGSLPRIMRYLNTSMPFVGLLDGEPVAVCMVEAQEGYHDIVILAVKTEEQGKGYARALLRYAMDSLRDSGGRYIDIGCGNARLRLYAMFQRAGFRVTGVWPDYYLDGNKTAEVENSIVNRDMIRFRADLSEKTLSTVGYDASGKR